jgi:hypothetical protein
MSNFVKVWTISIREVCADPLTSEITKVKPRWINLDNFDEMDERHLLVKHAGSIHSYQTAPFTWTKITKHFHDGASVWLSIYGEAEDILNNRCEEPPEWLFKEKPAESNDEEVDDFDPEGIAANIKKAFGLDDSAVAAILSSIRKKS